MGWGEGSHLRFLALIIGLWSYGNSPAFGESTPKDLVLESPAKWDLALGPVAIVTVDRGHAPSLDAPNQKNSEIATDSIVGIGIYLRQQINTSDDPGIVKYGGLSLGFGPYTERRGARLWLDSFLTIQGPKAVHIGLHIGLSIDSDMTFQKVIIPRIGLFLHRGIALFANLGAHPDTGLATEFGAAIPCSLLAW